MTTTVGASGTSDSVDLSLQQFAGAWTVMCGAAPDHIITSDGDLWFSYSGIPIPFFNVALLTGRHVSAGALASDAARACAWFEQKPVPWLFVTTGEALDPGVEANAVLDGSGLVELMPLTGMVADRVSRRERLPDGLDVADTVDDSACASALDINSAAYAMDLSAGKAVLGTRRFWDAHHLVVGRADGAPAACAAVMMVDGYRYVALVATEPGYQRRGFADAVMRRALERSAAAHGERPTVLHATAAGRPVYERMGYTTLANHTVFIHRKFLEGH